jgi:hypothetical protein
MVQNNFYYIFKFLRNTKINSFLKNIVLMILPLTEIKLYYLKLKHINKYFIYILPFLLLFIFLVPIFFYPILSIFLKDLEFHFQILQ